MSCPRSVIRSAEACIRPAGSVQASLHFIRSRRNKQCCLLAISFRNGRYPPGGGLKSSWPSGAEGLRKLYVNFKCMALPVRDWESLAGRPSCEGAIGSAGPSIEGSESTFAVRVNLESLWVVRHQSQKQLLRWIKPRRTGPLNPEPGSQSPSLSPEATKNPLGSIKRSVKT